MDFPLTNTVKPPRSISSPRVKVRAVTLFFVCALGARRALTAAVLSPLWFFRLSQDKNRCAHTRFMHRGHSNLWSITEEKGLPYTYTNIAVN